MKKQEKLFLCGMALIYLLMLGYSEYKINGLKKENSFLIDNIEQFEDHCIELGKISSTELNEIQKNYESIKALDEKSENLSREIKKIKAKILSIDADLDAYD